MPIFQADLDLLEREAEEASSKPHSVDPEPPPPSSLHPPRSQLQLPPNLARKFSEESLRTELCEGPLPDSPPSRTPEVEEGPVETITSDRAELIERLKRGESPTWVPHRHAETRRGLTSRVEPESGQFVSLFDDRLPASAPRSPRPHSQSPSLLPPADITPERQRQNAPLPREHGEDDRTRDGLKIQRPKSALHSGDFTEDQARLQRNRAQADGFEPASLHPRGLANPWMATSPPRDYAPFESEHGTSYPRRGDRWQSHASSLSSSLSSSFAYKPPTSPLVQSESNEELDLAMPMTKVGSACTPLNSRQYSFNSSPSPLAFPPAPSSVGRPLSLRRGSSLPSQAHQPRRSLASSTPYAHSQGTSPHTPVFLRSRRPSFGSDSSPLQHASMVGSYEESILRGRMSTTPSKPLDFLAQIGVLGLGNCKPSLKCPPHVTLPFPAVFYSYGNSSSHGRTQQDDGPSPYVGQIDLENGLPNQGDGHRAKRKMSSRYADRGGLDVQKCTNVRSPEFQDWEARKTATGRRRSGSPRAPPGGSYCIPEKGQLQIVIKNPNKTAVKLFLVPYDLSGMEPGTKTFMRQRSYSAGPILENAQLTHGEGVDKPTLRYLVHLHVCCPCKGRFYLYKSIRVVFANRVPDGKEKLRNETTWPEPRYTAYKPIRVMHQPSASGPGAMLAAEKAFRRRSSGFPIGKASPAYNFDAMEGVSQSIQGAVASWQHFSPSPSSSPSISRSRAIGSAVVSSSGGGGGGAINGSGGSTQPVEPIPLRLSWRDRLGSDVSESTTTTTTTGLRSPGSSQASRPTTKDGLDAQVARYEKLSKGDAGYGGNVFANPGGRSSPGFGTEGLISQRLRSLGVHGQGQVWGRPSSPPDGASE